MEVTDPAGAIAAAVAAGAGLGLPCAEPVVLSDGANVVVHLRPAPVVAKVAATTLRVRPDAAEWLGRELAVAAYLADRGVPVVPPSPEVPATVHHRAGRVLTFWRYAAHDRGRVPDPATAGEMLRDLHAALRGYPSPLPELGPLGDVTRYLAGPHRLPRADRFRLADAYQRLAGALAATGPVAVPLHGDPGVGNLLATAAGWAWCDLEDTCAGPVAWDLAALANSRRLTASEVIRGYGGAVDPAQLEICGQLRRLHLTVWYLLYAERLPVHRARAAELLASWGDGAGAGGGYP